MSYSPHIEVIFFNLIKGYFAEKNYNLTIPDFSSEEKKHHQNNVSNVLVFFSIVTVKLYTC